MPSGILGSASPGAYANTSLYTVPLGKLATVNINLCNRGAVFIKVRIAVATSGVPGNADYLEYDTALSANGVLERTGIVLEAGRQVVIYTDTATLSAIIYGMEE